MTFFQIQQIVGNLEFSWQLAFFDLVMRMYSARLASRSKMI
jgi:hypothetical protein